MYTAVGFTTTSEGFCASTGFESENPNPQDVANWLKSQFGVWFEQILLMKNGKESPDVVQHWNIDKDYFDID